MKIRAHVTKKKLIKLPHLSIRLMKFDKVKQREREAKILPQSSPNDLKYFQVFRAVLNK